jgi:hypothetical protein
MFSAFQIRLLVTQAGIPPHHLPVLCLSFAHHSLVLMLLPVVLAAAGIHRLFRDASPSPGAELYAATALVLAVLLLVVCILAWQVPYATASGEMI